MPGSLQEWTTKIRQEDLTLQRWNGSGGHSLITKGRELKSLPICFTSITVRLEVLILTLRVRTIQSLTIPNCKDTMSMIKSKNSKTTLTTRSLITKQMKLDTSSWFSETISDGAMLTNTLSLSTSLSITSTRLTLMSSYSTLLLQSTLMRYPQMAMQRLPGPQSMMTCSLMPTMKTASGQATSHQELMIRAMSGEVALTCMLSIRCLGRRLLIKQKTRLVF